MTEEENVRRAFANHVGETAGAKTSLERHEDLFVTECLCHNESVRGATVSLEPGGSEEPG